jgi:hypothetical protein
MLINQLSKKKYCKNISKFISCNFKIGDYRMKNRVFLIALAVALALTTNCKKEEKNDDTTLLLLLAATQSGG